MNSESTCTLVLTRQMVEDPSRAAVIDYRTCREELWMTHEEAVEQVIEQASEAYECLAGECYWRKPCFENSLLPREQSAAPVDDRERLAELEDWLRGAEHHAGCSGEYKKDDGSWAYRCKCGLRELRDERPVSPSVDPEER